MNASDATGSLLRMGQHPQESSSPLPSFSFQELGFTHFNPSPSSSFLNDSSASIYRDVQSDTSFELMKLDGNEKAAYLGEVFMVPITFVPSNSDPPTIVLPSSPPDGNGSQSSQKAPMRSKSGSSTATKNGNSIRLHQMDLEQVSQEQHNRVIRARRCKTYRDQLKRKTKCPKCLEYCKGNPAFMEYFMRVWKQWQFPPSCVGVAA